MSVDEFELDAEGVLTSYKTNNPHVVIPNTVKKISTRVFVFNDKIKDVSIPSTVAVIGDQAFGFCDSLESINVDSENKHYSSENGALFDKNFIKLIKCPQKSPISNFVAPENLKTIKDCAFKNCRSLKHVSLSEKTHFIGTMAFCDCDSLSDIRLPDSIKEIKESAFYGCGSLTNISLPDNLKIIRHATFANCTSLETVNFGKQTVAISFEAFLNCKSLKSVTVPDNTTHIGQNAFCNCTSLETVTIGNGVTNIDNQAFANCTSLKIMTILSNDVCVQDIHDTIPKTAVIKCNPDSKTEKTFKAAGYRTEPLITPLQQALLETKTQLEKCSCYSIDENER